jgi:hypothetical protein
MRRGRKFTLNLLFKAMTGFIVNDISEDNRMVVILIVFLSCPSDTPNTFPIQKFYSIRIFLWNILYKCILFCINS